MIAITTIDVWKEKSTFAATDSTTDATTNFAGPTISLSRPFTN